MAHVVLLSGTAQSGHNGSSKVERRLAEALAGHFAITLLTRDAAPLAMPGFVHAVYRRPSSQDWKTALLAGRGAEALRAIDRERPIDLVHAFATFPCAAYARAFGRPYVVTHHNMTLVPPSWIAGRATRAAVRDAAAAIALNDAQAVELRALGAPHVTVIGNGVGGEVARAPEVPLPQGFALFAGRLEAEKGIHLLLDAYAALAPERRRPLVIAGDGRDADAVRARATELGAVTLPWLAHEVLLGTLARAALLVVPSLSETSPLTMLEAFARGVPVAVHDLPMIAGELRDPDGAPRATVIPLGDGAAWSRALDRAAPPGDAAAVARARAAAEARTWPRVAAAYAQVYADVLRLPRPPGQSMLVDGPA